MVTRPARANVRLGAEPPLPATRVDRAGRHRRGRERDRLTRLAADPRLRAGVLVAVLAICAYALYTQWPQVSAQLARLHWYVLVLSLAATMAGTTCMMLAWRVILADAGSPLPLPAAARVNFVAGLGKYVPGAIWAFAAQVEIARSYRVPRASSVAAYVLSIALAIGAGLGLAAVALPLSAPGAAGRYLWVLAAVPVLAVCLSPPVFGRLLDRGLRLVRREPMERLPGWRALGKALGWTLVGWLLFGIPAWLLVGEMTGRDGYLLVCIGGFALAFSAGLLLIVFPSGIGAREVILVAALATVVPHGTAVAVALVARVITTASDLACGGVGLALGRVLGRAVPAGAPSAEPGEGAS
jgi:glycosyltransferase 2 family protein